MKKRIREILENRRRERKRNEKKRMMEDIECREKKSEMRRVLKEWRKSKGGEEDYTKKKENIRSYVKPRKKRRVKDGKEKYKERRMRNKFEE